MTVAIYYLLSAIYYSTTTHDCLLISPAYSDYYDYYNYYDNKDDNPLPI